MKNLALFVGLILLFTTRVCSQSDIAFHGMGAFTPQSMNHNAAYFPDVGFYFSFPMVSGVELNFDAGATYNDLMNPVANSDSVQIDIDGFLSSLARRDRLGVKGSVSAFQLGLNLKRFKMSVFSNYRYQLNFLYPTNFLNYFAKGNANFLGESVVNPLSFGGLSYREIGVSFAKDFEILSDKKITIGVRAKQLKGLFFLGSAKNASINMFTDENSYRMNIGFRNASVRTAGLNEIQGTDVMDYVLAMKSGVNQNNGFGFDLGAVLEINERLSTSLAVNDLGFINWTQDTETYEFLENEIVFDGLNDLNDIDVAKALEDSINAWTKSSLSETHFRTGVGTNVLASATYLTGKRGRLHATIGIYSTPFKLNRSSYGVGYTHHFGRILLLSTTVSKETSSSVRLGGGFAINTGAIQLFGSTENMLNYLTGADGASGADFRVGLNFMFAKTRQDTAETEKPKRKKKKKLSPFPPEYELDHLEDSDTEGTQQSSR